MCVINSAPTITLSKSPLDEHRRPNIRQSAFAISGGVIPDPPHPVVHCLGSIDKDQCIVLKGQSQETASIKKKRDSIKPEMPAMGQTPPSLSDTRV
jgi:hypothetical protein